MWRSEATITFPHILHSLQPDSSEWYVSQKTEFSYADLKFTSNYISEREKSRKKYRWRKSKLTRQIRVFSPKQYKKDDMQGSCYMQNS